MGENGRQRDRSSGGAPGGEKLDLGGGPKMQLTGLGDYLEVRMRQKEVV